MKPRGQIGKAPTTVTPDDIARREDERIAAVRYPRCYKRDHMKATACRSECMLAKQGRLDSRGVAERCGERRP